MFTHKHTRREQVDSGDGRFDNNRLVLHCSLWCLYCVVYDKYRLVAIDAIQLDLGADIVFFKFSRAFWLTRSAGLLSSTGQQHTHTHFLCVFIHSQFHGGPRGTVC